MSPSFVNDKSHPVRVKDEDGRLRRILSGQTVDADGRFADNLKAAGLQSASAEDQRSWENELQSRRGDVTDGPATALAAKLAIGPLRVAERLAIAAPLRRVVGDDAAPMGPPSGTITTKSEAAAESPEARRAFADHEALEKIESAGTPPPTLPGAATISAAEVHNAQAENIERAEEITRELDDVAASTDLEEHYRVDGGEPVGGGSASSEDDAESGSEDGGKLTGDALKQRAAEMEIEGRSDLSADELRAAIAEAEASEQ